LPNLLAAGGAKSAGLGDIALFTRDILRSGVKGVAMGRNVFEAEQPGEVVKAVSEMIRDAAGMLQWI
jgi:2-amino-4,5-dihydroxy-6-oxo-7-(phosphonooxy)heptanoate synthase